MNVKTKRKPSRVVTSGERITLPPDTRAYLSIRQIAGALSLSVRGVRELIAEGRYPQADVKPGEKDDRGPLGRVARWRVETHNAWCDETLSSAKRSPGT